MGKKCMVYGNFNNYAAADEDDTNTDNVPKDKDGKKDQLYINPCSYQYLASLPPE